MALPALVAAVRSVGVLTTNKGDLADGEEVSKRIVCVAVGDSAAGEEGGKGIVWTGERDMDDRISITGDGMKVDAEAPGTPSTCVVGTEPGGKIAKT